MIEPPAADSAVDNGEPVVSMENLFLYAINELEGNLGFLLTDNFGAHVLRLLLVVLSGQPLEENTPKSVLASKRKEKVSVANVEKEEEVEARAVPESFATALEKMIGDSVAGLETHYLRTLATHPIGNPTLQALIRIELTSFGKQRAKEDTSIMKKLLPDDPLVEGTESAAFINNLVYDAVGSRLLETIIEFAPGKLFKSLYKELFRDRMGNLARNEIAGYVVAKILERLSSEDLTKAVELILPQVPSLAERGRTSLVRTIIERCAARGVDTAVLASTIHSCWADDDKPEDLALWKMLQITPEEATAVPPPPPPMTSASTISPMDIPSPTTNGLPAQTTPPIPTTPAMLHSSHLAQTMLKTPGDTSKLINTAICNLTDTLCLRIAFTPILSPILQTSLTAPNAPLIFRRKLIKRFYSHICSLALDPAGSHLVDAIWSGTQGLAFARERIAEELAESESRLRDSRWGRMVWRNWKMDLYRRRRGEWVRSVRSSVGNDGFLSFPGGSGDEGTVTGIARAGEKLKNSKRNKKISQSEANATLRNGGSDARKVRRLEEGQQTPMLKQPVVPSRSERPDAYGGGGAPTSKSRLDQARERFVKNKEKKEREMAKAGTTAE